MSDSIDDLLPFYVLDSLTPDERQRVEAYLEANPQRRSEVNAMRKAAGFLPHTLPPVEPAPATKQALMARVRMDATARVSAAGNEADPERTPSAHEDTIAAAEAGIERRGRGVHQAVTPADREGGLLSGLLRRLAPAYALAGLALLAALAAGSLLIPLNAEVRRLRAEVAALRLDVQTQDELLATQQRDLAQINDRLAEAGGAGLQSFALSGTDVMPQAQGQLIADPSGSTGVLVVSKLTPLAADQTYQVWLIAGQTPVSAGLLQVDAQGRGVVIVEGDGSIRGYDALGVSIEPSGGSLLPTGDIVILSQIG